MAIFRLNQPFDAFHGTVSGLAGHSRLTLFASSKSAGVSRTWVKPFNPDSGRQQRIRRLHRESAAAYKALTQEQAATWIAAAAQINRKNILHLSYNLSGINLFVMINVYRKIDLVGLVADCPEIVAPPLPTAVTSVTLQVNHYLTVVGQVTGAHTGQLVMVRVSPPLPSANRKATSRDVHLTHTLVNWGFCIVAQVAGVVTFQYAAPAGEYAVGDRVGVELTPLSAAYFPGPTFLEPNIGVIAP